MEQTPSWRKVWVGLTALLAVAGCAGDHVGGSSQVGRVQGVYVEAYSGVFVDRSLAHDSVGRPVWVYVTFDHPLQDGRRIATAMLEQDPGVETGDLVRLRLAGDDYQADTPPTYNRVTALIAKHDSARARAFGLVSSSSSSAREALP